MTTIRKARSAARRVFRLCLVDGVLDPQRVGQAAQHIGRSRRRHAVAILIELRRLVKVERDRHTALVESASPLPVDVRQGVHAALMRRYGAGLDTSFAQNPELIGGMRIRVGSDVYDGSVRARLAVLEGRL
jgi:F-type H+-transporting ATPase subunit delta